MKTINTALILIGMAMISTAKAQDNASEKVYYKDTETLPYSVEETLGENIEIRSYPEAVAVASKGNDNKGAFRLLFNYISGANQASQELSMTSPVEMPTASASNKIAMTALSRNVIDSGHDVLLT
ncbi:heme-binding protein [Alteromonas gracilis]|uniref:heme-binding protein n=1 Tax=Alteromonas gracilis TaxID=1479524 RepID=UPI0030D369B7